MIRFILGCVSVLIFLLGSLVMVGCAAVAWLWIIAAASTQTHWSVGAALFVGGFYAGLKQQHALKAPWVLWHDLWLRFDAELEARTRR